ncbi:hypothetical protein PAHAL_1G016600 [Panicum hallii]|uniref:Uncharacterized protein n=1 Tax=Panicum hallii TaxID=206008 RepID=A0A2S3GKY7_9POAL|nr:hypothetical protein PAHAL_1G016600 [Panicum hallii]
MEQHAHTTTSRWRRRRGAATHYRVSPCELPSPTASLPLVSISTIQSKKGSLLAAKRSHSSLSIFLWSLLSSPISLYTVHTRNAGREEEMRHGRIDIVRAK